MKRSLRILSLVLVMIPSVAQVAKPIQFREEVFNFGDVAEKEGPVTHQFEFTNLSNRPVRILNVKPSCGCTTPDWTKDPVLPGKTGFIQARFDPKGRPGYFTKSLTVTTDFDTNPIMLQIKGTVNVEGKEANAEFNTSNGNWKMRNTSFNFGKVYIKDEYVVREFPIMNGGTKAIINSKKVDGPAHIHVSVEPGVLAPGEKGIIKLSYNGKLKNQYGFQTDNIVIHTDDEIQPDKSFSVFATLEDYFPPQASAETAKAPKLQVNEATVDFGRIKQNQAVVKEVTIVNLGKSALQVRAIQSNCSCIVAESTDKVLKAGASTTIKISFNPKDRKGTQQKSVTIYSSDPQNPVQRITLAAYVEG
ncbi:MAG TPA: DUF1573 domain-containing protein [Cyclobacteriaceae bacterium]|nr:DUF1573 domain-containing protein [Cyclobacteriaceae bacterium]